MEEFPLEAASELELLGVEEAASEEEEEGSEEAGSEEASEEVSELEEVSSGYMAPAIRVTASMIVLPWRSISSGSITMTLPSWTAFSLERVSSLESFSLTSEEQKYN